MRSTVRKRLPYSETEFRDKAMNKLNENNAKIGERIRETRLKRCMTQEMLSEKAGVCNPQQISNIERGLSGMSIAKFKDICTALDIDADYILFGVSTHNVETILNKYIKEMTNEQLTNLLEMVKAYAKTCGIEEK